MKNQSISHLLYGLASGFLLWSIYEIALQFIFANFSNASLQSGISGIIFSVFFGIFVLLKDGVFYDNAYKIKRGALYGTVSGLIGALVSFILVEAVFQSLVSDTSPTYLFIIINLFQWTLVAFFVGLGLNFRDGSRSIFARNIIFGSGSGLVGAVIFVVLNQVLDGFWARGVALNTMMVAFSLSLFYGPAYSRTSWLKSLNGNLEGTDFELTKEIHYLGTQSNDDINLKSYQEIRPSHAKLIRYHAGYSIVDNDPFWQTFVNFRNIKEQPLKNGDIIKIGQALFQYCSTD